MRKEDQIKKQTKLFKPVHPWLFIFILSLSLISCTTTKTNSSQLSMTTAFNIEECRSIPQILDLDRHAYEVTISNYVVKNSSPRATYRIGNAWSNWHNQFIPRYCRWLSEKPERIGRYHIIQVYDHNRECWVSTYGNLKQKFE